MSVFFGKILRMQSRAQVLFSHPIVLKYGSGSDVTVQHDEDEKKHKNSRGFLEVKKPSLISCPVLEFRIANRLHDEVGDEIIDAKVQAVASADGRMVEHGGKTTMERLKELINSGKQTEDESLIVPPGAIRQPLVIKVTESLKATSIQTGERRISFGTQVPQEEQDNYVASTSPNFSELVLEASEHPYFRRVWVIQHILNDTSPLLSAKTRKLIRKNNGYWPAKLNNASALRNSLKFNQILVSLVGISNRSGDGVSARNVYDLVDVVIGYQFVDIFYRSRDGTVKVDLNLLNDVKEQSGGGGEYLGI